MDGFKQALMKQFRFSERDWETTEEYFSIEVVKTKEHFIRQNEIADKLGFVKSGLLRSYYYDESGKEITLQFFQKGTVVISPESFNNGTPTNESIIAYEDSELITISKRKFDELYKLVPVWQHICKGVSEMKNTKLLRRTIQFQTSKAAERYNNFCNEYPEIIQKVPLGHIASYLGIDIATLSRLRSKH